MSPRAEAAWPFELGVGLAGDRRARLPAPGAGEPTRRLLRVFSHDPSRSRYDGAHLTLSIPYEPLTPGPTGALFVVEDVDQKTGTLTEPVDLDDHRLLIENGLSPSSSLPQFMQQMAYAVGMETYERFTVALGRDPGFGPLGGDAASDGRLRIHPRYMREDNAYYDREYGSLAFGYCKAENFAQQRSQPGSHVYLVLSRDIVAHEVSHALLDGLRPNFIRPTHRDVGALHEGFSDLVAIFLRFAQPELVRNAIEDSQGKDLDSKLLVEVGHQFGFDLIDGTNPLRTAILSPGLDAAVVDPKYSYQGNSEEHDLGAVLVSAVFEAFRRIYQRKTIKLRSMLEMTKQTRLPAEGIHLLANVATQLARRFLNIVIRAIDYCPPLHCTFGEYLRAIVTADTDLVPDDVIGYRDAFVTAFRRYGVIVPEVADLSEESLVWRAPESGQFRVPALDFRHLGLVFADGLCDWPADDEGRAVTRAANALGQAICRPERARDFGLVAPSRSVLPPRIASLRTVRRVSTGGEVRFDLVAEVVQKRRVREGWFLGGSTIIVSSDGRVRFAVGKHLDSRRRLAAQREFLKGQPGNVRDAAWDEHSVVAARLQRRIHLRR
ncbi:hypothetical protein [Stenotrophomonas sp. PS02289]|uniref:hypothetical protein n=1 Tax=Stenotrophomonas sp. PS02289 TaxID=2991422 RepID=UPI00249BF883|nr:hypothetical protein [Stenotrophomonas sp. PS02289]